MMIDTTKLGYKWRGNFDPATNYKRGDVVRKDGIIQRFTGSSFVVMTKGQQSAPTPNSLFRAGSNAPLTKAVGQELAVGIDGLPEARFDVGRRSNAAIALPKTYFRNSSLYHGGTDTNTAVMSDGSIMMWGASRGIGTTSGTRLRPVEIPFPRDAGRMVKHFALRADFFSIDQYGRLWGWGANRNGCLGVGDTAARDLPVLLNGLGDIPANARFVDVEMGAAYSTGQATIAITETGEAYFAGYSFSLNSSALTLDWTRIPVDAHIVGANVSGSSISGNRGNAVIDAEGRAYFSGGTGYTARITNQSANQPQPTLWNLSTFKPVKAIQFSDDFYVSGTTTRSGRYGSSVVFQDGTIATRQRDVRSIDIRDPAFTSTVSDNLQFYPDERIDNISELFVAGSQREVAVAMKNDGTVWATGRKSNLVTGYLNTNEWEQITELGDKNIKMVAANENGTYCFCFLRSDGTVGFIGHGGNGHPGAGRFVSAQFQETITRRPIIDVSLSGLLGGSGLTTVATFLQADGTLLTSGSNSSARLGNVATTSSGASRAVPSPVIT